MSNYVLPVGDVRKSTYVAHTVRYDPSDEPGVDYYCPIGTPIRVAETGTVVDIGRSIIPATGWFVTVDLDNGSRVRYLHLSQINVGMWQRVTRGEIIARSGATGYGKTDWSDDPATGGAHVHVTLWPFHEYRFGAKTSGTLDFHAYADTDSGVPADYDEMEFDDMSGEEIRDIVREEIGGALSAFAAEYARQVAQQPLSEDNKKWVRDQTRQEIGGALSGFTNAIADAVAAKIAK